MYNDDAIRTRKINGVVVKVLPDTMGDHECPLDTIGESDGIKFLTWERRSILSTAPYNDFANADDALKYAKGNGYEVFPLYKYDHGLLSYSVNSFIGRAHHAEWDSGQVGFVLIKKTMYRGPGAGKKRRAMAESWCNAMTTWCNGDYYGYTIVDKEGNELDSCWGFDDADYCEQEAIRSAAHYAEEIQEREAREAEDARGDMYA